MPRQIRGMKALTNILICGLSAPYHSALAQVNVDQAVILKSAGTWAWLLWRSVYLSKQVSLRNRLLVMLDWLKCRLFGRDTTIIDELQASKKETDIMPSNKK